MAARTGARTGLSPPALASKSCAFNHSATEGIHDTYVTMILDIIGNKYRLLVCASEDRHGLTHRRHDGYDAGPLSGIVASAAAVVGSHGNDSSFQCRSKINRSRASHFGNYGYCEFYWDQY